MYLVSCLGCGVWAGMGPWPCARGLAPVLLPPNSRKHGVCPPGAGWALTR